MDINVHLGDSPRCMDLIDRVIAETEIPSTQFLPTHVNRNAMLFEKALEYAKRAAELYENCRLVIIKGDTHCYDYHLDLVTETLKEFLLSIK